ncbi:MAG: Rpn family recombination-promoting nuclease/putative transposase, partial [Oscillospiraceae bacterium]|nr:Rpn family recombination-promoting nuclease/putative transposase [Oscillospiraceae bacterium]
MTKLRYNFKSDVLFKVFFVRSQDQLRQLVAAMLKIAIESIERFEVTNVEIPPDVVGDKFCRLDINMIVNSQHVNLEIQVHDEGDFPERLMYYWAREFSSKLQEGKHYIELPRT